MKRDLSGKLYVSKATHTAFRQGCKEKGMVSDGLLAHLLELAYRTGELKDPSGKVPQEGKGKKRGFFGLK